MLKMRFDAGQGKRMFNKRLTAGARGLQSLPGPCVADENQDKKRAADARLSGV
jgi:hypothetical protein